MGKPLHALIVEDSVDDFILLVRQLRTGGYEPIVERVETAPAMQAAIEDKNWDIVIADYSMPYFSALDALKLLQEHKQDIPFIILSGTIGEDVAVAAMRAGAHDYIMKGKSARLLPAIERELQESEVRRENKRAEEALLQAKKLENLGLMASGIAHDFNNLLVAMLGQSSTALAKLPPESPASDHVFKCMQAAERASDVTRQMLAYAGRSRIEYQPVNINQLIEDNLQFLETAVPKNVHLHTELCDDLPFFNADPGQMQQVMMNLIINAAQAMGEQTGTITIVSRTQGESIKANGLWQHLDELLECDSYIIVEVRDTGTGMDKETIPKIFDPFYTTKKSGRGLGLAAVLGIVIGHKGGLYIDSQLGEGTIFKLIFPAVHYEISSEADQIDEIKQQTGLILIIDDEESVCYAVTDILELHDIQVLSASNGSDGISIYQEQKNEIDLVLLDLSMPGLSSDQTLKALRQINPSVRVILSSGYSHSEVVKRFSDNGLAGFLQKPYSASKLVHTVQKHLGRFP